MLLSLVLLKLINIFLWAAVAFLIWNILVRPLLMEKVFSLILAFLALSFWLFLNGLEFLPLVILLLYIGAISVLFLFVVMIINPDFTDLLYQKQRLVYELQQRQNMLSTLMDQRYSTNNQNILSFDEQKKLTATLTSNSFAVKPLSSLTSTTSYYSFFFFSLLAGSFLSGVLSWHQFVAFKFNLASMEVTKFLQIYSTAQAETLIDSQLGSLSDVAMSLAGLKIQAIYYPSFLEKHEMINIGLLLYTKYGIALIIIGLMLLVSMIGAIVLTLRQTTFVKRQHIGTQLVRYSV